MLFFLRNLILSLALFGLFSACEAPFPSPSLNNQPSQHDLYRAECEKLKSRLAQNRRQQWIAYSRPAGSLPGVSGEAVNSTSKPSRLDHERAQLLFVYRKNCQAQSVGEHFLP